MTTTHKQTPRVATRKSQEGIHRLQLTTTMDKQTRQQIQQPITALQMGQIYPLTHLTHLHIRQCLKTFARWVLAGALALVYLGFLAVNM